MKLRALHALALVLSTAGFSQDLTPRAPAPKGTVVIVDATIHPVSGPVIEHGSIAFDGAAITAVGKVAPPAGATVIDGKGKHVYPGLIGAVTQLGLTEIGSVRASRDFTEAGDITPEVRAGVAVNPDSTLFPVTRANGVLAAGVFPSGGVIPGRASVIQLEGWTSEEMTVDGNAGVVVNWPAGRGGGRGRFQAAPEKSEEEQARESNAAVTRIEDFFRAADGYLGAKDRDPSIPTDLRLEAMRGLRASKNAPAEHRVFVNAQEYDQILAAVGFASRLHLNVAIVGGRDAGLLADLLKARGIGVIVAGTFRQPRRADSNYDDAYTLPARLEAAGVKWCLASGDETPHERNLPYAAGLAVAHGLAPEAALRAITLSAAELLGVQAKLGSLEAGKLATLIVTDGDPLEITTKVERAFISGRELDLSSKQTKLAEKYRAKYREGQPSGR
jgi:imidazolonepropionase-like amidohydrolase